MSVVLVGAFVPEKFLPGSLAEAEVIPKSDANAAVPKTLLSRVVLEYKLLWADVSVTTDRFQVTTREAPYVRGCDMVVKALRELSAESRVDAFGVNVESHFDVGSSAARDAIGRRLAPPEAWGQWGENILKSMESPTLHGGMMSLHMRNPFREELISGWMDIVVEPSNRIVDNRGVYFRSNHHHQFRQDLEHKPDSFQLIDALTERFDGSVAVAENIFNDILDFDRR